MNKGSSTSQTIQQAIPEIMQQWEVRALKEVSATYGQSSLFLRNSLPNLLESIASLLLTDQPSAEQLSINAAEMLQFSKAHGRGRAEISVYLMSQVMTEYQILRQVLFEVLDQRASLTPSELNVILNSLEQAMNTAATEFAATLKEIYEMFTLSIAHDLKTPIASIQAGVQLLHRIPEASFTIPLTERLAKQTQQMTDLVNLILETSQLQGKENFHFSLSELDLVPIARDLVEDMKLVYGDRFLITSKESIIGFWNSDYLRRMLENLVHNAVRFGLPESLVTISIQQDQDNTLIEVHNIGEPISLEDQKQLFTMHRRLSLAADQKGWGLGLPLVKGIVKALQGSIRVISDADKGTRFIVEIPNHRVYSLRSG